MEFFLDTGIIAEIKEAVKLGIIDGVTTNPSLIAKTGRKQEDVIKEISEITGVSINTSLGRMRYALMNLRKVIDKHQIVLTN